jgi:hypothetical protein
MIQFRIGCLYDIEGRIIGKQSFKFKPSDLVDGSTLKISSKELEIVSPYDISLVRSGAAFIGDFTFCNSLSSNNSMAPLHKKKDLTFSHSKGATIKNQLKMGNLKEEQNEQLKMQMEGAKNVKSETKGNFFFHMI